jgi:hypothetical protein
MLLAVTVGITDDREKVLDLASFIFMHSSHLLSLSVPGKLFGDKKCLYGNQQLWGSQEPLPGLCVSPVTDTQLLLGRRH